MKRLPVLLGLALCAGTAAEAAVPPQAKELSALRLKVDQLAERLREARQETRGELAALRAERAELRRLVRLEKVRQATLQKIAAERTAQAAGLEGQSATWRPALTKMLAAARGYVEDSLPYQRAKRTESLRRIEADLNLSQADFAGVLGRLWRFVEEEQALGREIARTQQTVNVAGEKLLVDAIHLAMAGLYFRAPDGRVGLAVRQEDKWVLQWAVAGEATEVLNELFAAFDDNRTLGRQRVLVGVE